ncbi:MAG: hypothetical protein FWG20_06215 [Candidatus Cloacimonetes bacterium]|nr:hypothetical protein [Candidatus Cloacimonadota bacterium]
MRVLKRIILVAILGLSFLLVACGPKPPTITKQNWDTAKNEADSIDARVTGLRAQKSRLEAELNAKTAKLEALLEMEKE